jgi:hypothetical protein
VSTEKFWVDKAPTEYDSESEFSASRLDGVQNKDQFIDFFN